MARNEDSLQSVSRELSALAVQGTITSKQDLKKLVETAMGSYGRIDVVVNNTVYPPKGGLLDLSEEDWHEGMDLVLMNVA